MHWLTRYRWFSVLVILPVVIAAIYYGLIASDIYVSESRFVVKTVSQRSPQVATIASLIQTTGMTEGREQTDEVMDFIRSRNALEKLSQQVNIRARYTSADADFASRYPAPFSKDRFENFYRYYLQMVDAHLDTNTGLAVLTVNAFRPEDARAINEQLLNLSEALVNRLNNKARANAIAESENLVIAAEQRVRNARLALAAYRNRSDLLDPSKQAAGVFDVANRLVADQAALRAQLDQVRRVAPGNPSAAVLEQRIAALSTQIASQTGRAVGSGTAISSKLSGYETLTLEQEFAAQMLTQANTQLAQSRSEAQRQQFYLERVVEPNTPDLARLPHRLARVATLAGILIALYFIGWMFIVGILEHAPED